VGVRVRKPFLW